MSIECLLSLNNVAYLKFVIWLCFSLLVIWQILRPENEKDEFTFDLAALYVL